MSYSTHPLHLDRLFIPFSILLLFITLAIWGTRPTQAAVPTVTVTTLADSGTGSLREALTLVDAGGTIDFDADLSGGSIVLASKLSIDKGITISSSVPITVSGNNSVQLFYVNSVGDVTLRGLTLRDGSAVRGGAIYVNTVLNLEHVHIVSNTSTGGTRYYDGADWPLE